MNSYIRQSAVPADQMHSFLKDKQAWENAIALYQGPDPLDHWWNYICWYENHGHGDPDNKFRETLERCLTLYEHSDYYKQDVRMLQQTPMTHPPAPQHHNQQPIASQQLHNHMYQNVPNHYPPQHQSMPESQVSIIICPILSHMHRQMCHSRRNLLSRTTITGSDNKYDSSTIRARQRLPPNETLSKIRNKQMVVQTLEASGIMLPKKFATYSRNNHETWQPALFLEEPDDPQKICHYAKTVVYPADLGVEFSPEEIKSRKYKRKMEELKQKFNQQIQNQQSYEVQLNAERNEINREQQHNAAPAQQQHQRYQQKLQQRQHEQEQQLQQQQQQQQFCPKGQAEETEGYQEEDDEDEDNQDTEDEQQYDHHQSQQQHQNYQYHLQPATSLQNLNSLDAGGDLEDQIEASTIRFSMHTPNKGSQNKTLKIKFKKERTSSVGKTSNGNNYSAYTIERNYKSELESLTLNENALKRNGSNNSFHPYMLGQTSTPKTTVKRQRQKIKKSSNKFQMLGSTNSNSSSAENAVALDNSHCSLTNAVGRLNFRDATALNNTTLNQTNVADISTYQKTRISPHKMMQTKELRLAKALDTIERHMARKLLIHLAVNYVVHFLPNSIFPGQMANHTTIIKSYKLHCRKLHVN
ncbi:hypothetical protein EVAR_72212_1 [Eumeta japonica]|uniref:BUB1 N-terminal domain-containing protein n=1 Tax=Eumeta variegata TaxID=151549 RepID=A0A4C1TKD3_EUMVA|nr:hypothetical protein EVAR_72212_1 [Eumeta japonica]